MNGYYCCGLNADLTTDAGSTYQDWGSGFDNAGCGQSNFNISGVVELNGSRISGGCSSGNQSLVSVLTGGNLKWDNGGCVRVRGNESCLIGSTGSETHAKGITFVAAGTGKPIGLSGTARFFDECDNSASGGAANIFPAGSVYGSCSIAGTALVAGNVALTSGWGTSTVTSASGNSQRGQFTIAATGTPGANPVVTVTFPNPFFAAPSCTIVQIGGTFGVLTNAAVGIPTRTTVAVTFAGTAVAAQTYTLVLDCRN